MTDKRFLFCRIWIAPEDTVEDWVPGKPAELDRLIKRLGGAAAHFREGAEKLRKLNTDPCRARLSRSSARRSRNCPRNSMVPWTRSLRRASPYSPTAKCLRVQRLTRQILDHEAPTARDLSRQYARAVDDYYVAIKAGDTKLPTRPPETNPGRTAKAELIERINSAQGEVTEAAGIAKRTLHKAAGRVVPEVTGFQSRRRR